MARDASFRINGCTHGGSFAWHMVPCSNQLLHAMQHCLARDASLQNQWLHTWQRRCLARDASLRINGGTHGCSTAWHMVPSSNQLLHAMQHRLAWDASLQNQWLRTWQQDCLARDPCFESMAARMAAASLGTWCLSRISCYMQCSIAWHGMPRFKVNGLDYAANANLGVA